MYSLLLIRLLTHSETGKRIMKTYLPKEADIKQAWHLLDATDQRLGRVAVKVATILRGKHKAMYTPSMDTGDFVVIVNAEKIAVTGSKTTDKKYYHHTLYPGGIKEISFEKLLQDKPEEVIKKAVKGMLPEGPLGKKMFSKLKVYTGSEHPHDAQKPQVLA